MNRLGDIGACARLSGRIGLAPNALRRELVKLPKFGRDIARTRLRLQQREFDRLRMLQVVCLLEALATGATDDELLDALEELPEMPWRIAA